jgi:type III pantothenate kinase
VLFTLDIGNSNVVAGIFEGSRLKTHWRFETRRAWKAGELAALLRGLFNKERLATAKVEGAIISCVVPRLDRVSQNAASRLFGCPAVLVSHRLDLGISIKTARPADVGADRLVLAAAAWQRIKGPVLVLDMGTAITVDAVNGRGEYIGGAIAPGVSVSLQALVQRAAAITDIELKKPKSAIGRGTAEAVRSGIYNGTVGQVGELLRSCRAELGGKAVIIATGGWAGWVPLKKLGVSRVDPNLILKGLRFIYLRNLKKGGKPY